MPISEWFKAREDRRYTSLDPSAPKTDVPDGVWEKCPSCKHIVYAGDLEHTDGVCPHCGHHFELTAPERVGTLADEDSFAEMDADLISGDPLSFTAAKPYTVSVATARESSGLSEAIVTGRATLGGHPVVLGVMDFRFIGASMGSVVGEKVARAFEVALAERRAVIMVTASGGARMQEGMLSLMQMAKTAAAAERLASAALPYIVVLANNTYGGVTASFATLGDVVLAEPGAMVGFAGPRLVEQATKLSLPKGFQTAESLVEHGMVDAVVPRAELRETLTALLGYLTLGGAS
ncbi:MAG: acetyl-CoA carboxylase carboxyl transferase subunit beta [Coriobacteriaceae bacterium]|nr:acetyl-CoA carboxylase carboxyl transferase subunit beta [Coriobacteriaceae bacterium]